MSDDGSWPPPADDLPPERPPPAGSGYARREFTQPPFVQLPSSRPASGSYEGGWPARGDERADQREPAWPEERFRGDGYADQGHGTGRDPLWPARPLAVARPAPAEEADRPGPKHGSSPRRNAVRLVMVGLIVVGVAAAVAVRQSGSGSADQGAASRWEAEQFGGSQLLVSDSDQVCSVTSDSLVYCLDPATGDEVFSRQLYLSVVTSPTLADGGILVGGSSSGSAGTVFAYTAEGEDLWEAPLDITADRPLLVVGDVVALASGDGRDGALVGLDLATGAERWRAFDAAAGTTAQLLSTHLFTDGVRLYAAVAEGITDTSLGTGYIVALDPATGQEIWRSQALAGIGVSRVVASAAPFADGSAAAFAIDASPSAAEEGSQVVVLDSATGAVRWEVPTVGSAEVAHADGLVIVLDGSDLRGYDSAGSEVWSSPVPVSEDAPGQPAVTGLVLEGDRLFGIGRDVYAIDPATGATEIAASSGTTSDVAVAGDALVVAGVFSVSAVPLADVPFGEQQVTVVTG